MQPTISVVVPVFNAEKHLRKMLNSIKAQSFHDFEVLLVDDGSTDDSAAICEEFASSDERFCLYRKKNGGVCSARNLGIEYATGEYICFFDADDFVDRETFSECIPRMKASGADILIFGMSFDYEKNGQIVKTNKKSCNDALFDLQELDTYYHQLYTKNYITSMCNRIVKLELIREDNIRFNEKLTNYEDMEFGLRCFRPARRIQCVAGCYYHYMKRETPGASGRYSPMLNATLRDTVESLTDAIYSLPLTDATKQWAHADVQRILWLGLSNICKQKKGFFAKRREVRDLCRQPWVKDALPMMRTGNTYNDMCLFFCKNKCWFFETAWNEFTNFVRRVRYR